MQAGTWYPDAPETENEDEESALAEINTYLTKKDPAVLSLLTECASYISNLLNDVYIEEKMCSLFPGSIKKGILVNRRRNVEWIPPLKELLEGNPDPVSVFLKVLVQYALRGYVNSWNMESCEMLDTLNEVKQLVDLSVEPDSDLIRYQATNRILLKMWKYFRKLLEKLKQECQEPEENGEKRPISCGKNANLSTLSTEFSTFNLCSPHGLWKEGVFLTFPRSIHNTFTMPWKPKPPHSDRTFPSFPQVPHPLLRLLQQVQ